ncbi:unnamed protein product [Schistosoma intercalatum]|nr:unnamed protein product [Schistosoma intercalatum]
MMANHFFYSRLMKKRLEKYRILSIIVIFTVILTAFWVINIANLLQKHTRALDNIQKMILGDSYNIQLNKYGLYDEESQCDIQLKDLTGYPECLSKIEVNLVHMFVFL